MAVTKTDNLNLSQLQAEVARLRQELTVRDQLVRQLSQELFRLVRGHVSSASASEVPDADSPEAQMLKSQLQGVEQQVTFYQEQIAARDSEIHQLRQSVGELTDRSRMLEQVVQELPQVYRRKFAERMIPFKEKVINLHQENRRLHAELQSVSYRLAVRTRRTSYIELPSFPRPQRAELPTFGSA